VTPPALDTEVVLAKLRHVRARSGVLPVELAERLAPSAGLRNILVHEYVEVDLAQVVRAAERARTDYREYVAAIAQAL
jgi:uncharacterized protein YutE (UPF0331/DUF86 family)